MPRSTTATPSRSAGWPTGWRADRRAERRAGGAGCAEHQAPAQRRAERDRPGEAKPLYYWDRHLVGWRDAEGAVHVQDAFCPHLGAHLGHGGTVDGCEIVCPFHGWKFDAEGTNTDIPYSERTNRKGSLRTFAVSEVNGVSMVWYHPDADVAPQWEIPELPEFNGDPEWSTVIRTAHTVEAA